MSNRRFTDWADAVAQADRYAALTRLRYSVRREPMGTWWIEESLTSVVA